MCLLIFLYGDILYMQTGEPDDTKKKDRKTTMKRIEIDREIKAKSIEKACEKFAKVLISRGYEWAAIEMVESVNNGYYYCCNATEVNLVKGARPVSPINNDWTYYWAIEDIDDNVYYAWFIDKSDN